MAARREGKVATASPTRRGGIPSLSPIRWGMAHRSGVASEAFVSLWDWGHFRLVDGTEAHPDDAFVGLGLM